ncbi:MAG: GNAT family N-acetyltransferase [Rhodospirillaceae bacterium]|jgi:GNAT superfamily N-acetyltransferase|nr:GNAT family N-acetyltransferase [Rhodospirillaceae bacterium]MBT4690111.1 GNAT family N-acetyltransferase [Rhodospirillaceae bacterium]MBT5080676.1 GNAT family N-acetyltransferase [Rhodospirillaceae bacterium]MBT5524204.1 GNAT family N-acetyltransferase [Rhodospirillaceae bacterium]MBT5881275.1 GNAT family N-acetyltransferase [Rhodospirillaceae bacterium]
MRIRPVLETDLDELFTLYAHYTASENRPPLSEARMAEIWREVERNPGVEYFALEQEGRIAATCILSITPSFIRGGSGYGVIEHVVTHADFRRRGFAKALMEFTLEHAWNQGCTEVMLLSGRDLAPAHKLYEGLGFDKHQRTGFIIFKP